MDVALHGIGDGGSTVLYLMLASICLLILSCNWEQLVEVVAQIQSSAAHGRRLRLLDPLVAEDVRWIVSALDLDIDRSSGLEQVPIQIVFPLLGDR